MDLDLYVNPWLDLSIEQVASIAQQSQTLPSPTLDLSQLLTTGAPYTSEPSRTNGHTTSAITYGAGPVSPPVPAYSESDPWNTNFRPVPGPGSIGPGMSAGGSSLMGGLPSNWWNRQEKIAISIFPEKQGFILNRYTVYVLQPDVRTFIDLTEPGFDAEADILVVARSGGSETLF